MMDTKLCIPKMCLFKSWNVVVCRATAIQLVQNSKPDTHIRHTAEKYKCAECVLQ
jgi:hypothetical protein